MIEDVTSTEDPDARAEQNAEIAAKLQEEAASVFLDHEGAVWGSPADVANLEPHPLDYYALTADLPVG